MAAQIAEVKCITKAEQSNPHERITHIGGDGVYPWKLPLDQAINQIEKGRWTFYLEGPAGDRIWVLIAEHDDGSKYLTTEDDGQRYLLNLPQCP